MIAAELKRALRDRITDPGSSVPRMELSDPVDETFPVRR
jgi:hypothetical protein